MAHSRLRQVAADLGAAGLRAEMATAALGGATAIHAARLARDLPPRAPPTAAATLSYLFVAGWPVELATLERMLGPGVAELVDLALVEVTGDRVSARRALVPHRGALVACPWSALPDDSSFHLLGALPDRVAGAWLDIGTGCGFLPLLRPRLGDRVEATDVSAELLAHAAFGAALSALDGRLELARSDLFDRLGGRRWNLISFNAPIEGAEALVARFWAAVPRHLEPGGEAVVHSIAAPATALPASGELVTCIYTPADHRPVFAVTRWRPSGPAARRTVRVTLSRDAPHVARDWICAD